MVRSVVGSILHGGPIELFPVPTKGARGSSEDRAFAHGGSILHGGPIELFPVPTKGARGSSEERAFAHGAMDRLIDPSW